MPLGNNVATTGLWVSELESCYEDIALTELKDNSFHITTEGGATGKNITLTTVSILSGNLCAHFCGSMDFSGKNE